jgi:transposase InsO family protein
MNARIMEHGQPVPETKCAALWLTAAQIGGVERKHPRGVRDRLNRLVAGLNGTGSRYRRDIATTGGFSYEYNYALMAEDFPGTVKPEALRAAIEKYSDRDGQEQLALEPVTAAPVQPAPVEEQTTLALPFPKEIAEVHEIPERARPLAEARFRAIEHAIGDNWCKWKGQSVHGILVRVKCDFVDVLARDYKLAARGQACLVDWNAIHAELAQGTRIRARDERLESSFKKRLWNWLRWYKKGKQTGAFKFAPGIAALQDAPTVHAGKSKLFGEVPRSLDFHDEAKMAAEFERMPPAGKRLFELMLIEKHSVQMTQEILLCERAELGLPETLSHSAVNRFYKRIPKPLLLWSRGRAKDFHDQCAHYARRDYTTCDVMQWQVLDHGQDDFFVCNDYIPELNRLAFPEVDPNEELRMWWTIVMDAASRLIVGYAVCAIPNSDTICSAQRMAILRTGRAPQFVLIDNGEDFKKTGKNRPNLPPEAQGVLLRLIKAQWGVSGEIIFSIGDHPQSKTVERWFGTKRTRFDKQVDSYCGRSPENRPDHCKKLLNQHEQFLLGKREESPLPRASEAIIATACWIEKKYNQKHRHSGQGMGRRTPDEVFRRGYPDSERQEALAKLDRNALDVFLRHRESRIVFDGGCVKMFGQEFEPADEKSRGRLLACIKREVLFAVDAYRVGDAVAFDPQTGERLGDLICKKLLAWGASKADIRANMRLQRGAAKSCRTYVEHLRRTYQAPKGAFGFLGEEALRATGTDGMRALPPGRPLNFAGAPAVEAAPVITSDFVKKHGDFGDVKVEED